MSKIKQSHNRKSSFNPSRLCYLTEDGKFYCYEIWDEDRQCYIQKKYEVGEDISLDLATILDESDHDIDLNDRYEQELRDPCFDAKVNNYNLNGSDSVNPWDTIADKKDGPEESLLAEPKPEKPQIVVIRRVIEEECSVAQQNLFYDHFGMGTSLETIRQVEMTQSGKSLSHNAVPNRKNKIIDKAAKSLGVKRVRRHTYSKKR